MYMRLTGDVLLSHVKTLSSGQYVITEDDESALFNIIDRPHLKNYKLAIDMTLPTRRGRAKYLKTTVNDWYCHTKIKWGQKSIIVSWSDASHVKRPAQFVSELILNSHGLFTDWNMKNRVLA